MPLSRTRSLLANINSSGSSLPGSAANHQSGGTTTQDFDSCSDNTITSYQLPSINVGTGTAGGSTDHLPPLRSSLSLSASGNGGSNGGGGTVAGGNISSSSSSSSYHNKNNLNLFNSSANGGSSVNTTSAAVASLSLSSSLRGEQQQQQQQQQVEIIQDLDNMSTTGSIISTASLTNGHLGSHMTNGGGSSTSSGGNGGQSTGIHINGLQTLPHVRPSGLTTTNGTNGTSLNNDNTNGGVSVVSSTLESPKHHLHSNGVGGGGSGSVTSSVSVTSSNVVNGNNIGNGGSSSVANNSNGVGSGGSSGQQQSNSIQVNGSNNGTVVKPKTMVATPEQVMKLYMNKLTPYEHHEIFNYPQIYFIGANAKKRPGIIAAPNNCGYDDDQGSYTHIPHDHLAYRYEVLKVIGKGSFGQVVKAYDHKNHHHVALKMVRNEKRFHRQAQEEIRILEHLRKQDKDNTYNIIHLFDHFTFRSHTCITFELLSINLYELIKKNKFQGFSLQLVRKFAHSLLQCLDLLFRNKIIHCDMKPENVLLKQQGRSGIKVSCQNDPRYITTSSKQHHK